MANILYNIVRMNGKSKAGIVICIFFIVTEMTREKNKYEIKYYPKMMV